jgi:hypothetical protein
MILSDNIRVDISDIRVEERFYYFAAKVYLNDKLVFQMDDIARDYCISSDRMKWLLETGEARDEAIELWLSSTHQGPRYPDPPEPKSSLETMRVTKRGLKKEYQKQCGHIPDWIDKL